jgi:predicted nucleic acid-binding protein
MPRVVIDTNVWVSAFVGAPGAPFRVVNAALAG